MPELRQDPVTRKWVIIATERSKRPSDFAAGSGGEKGKGGGLCPFCSGNEDKTPPEVMSYRSPDTKPDTPGWWIRVVPNKFPALEAPGREGRPEVPDFFLTRAGTGAHEVIIESPDHAASLEVHQLGQLEEIFRAWRARLGELLRRDEVKYVQIFKNAGAPAGASLEHPHSQVIAVPLIPPALREEIEGAKEYYEEEGACIYCEIAVQEAQRRVRLVTENEDFLVFCPFAARFPFETWILPKKHEASFTALRDEELPSFGAIVKDTMARIATVLKNPPYNLLLHTAPKGFIGTPYYHWHIEILPRLTAVAGFEFGTGIYINPTPPEEAASFLRG